MYVRCKPGVRFDVIAPAGFRILGAIERVARERLKCDLTITCACEAHATTNPHALGEAYDIRTHGLDPDQRQTLLRRLMIELSGGVDDMPMEVSGGLATQYFFAWIEHVGLPNEHLHVQRRKHTQYGEVA